MSFGLSSCWNLKTSQNKVRNIYKKQTSLTDDVLVKTIALRENAFISLWMGRQWIPIKVLICFTISTFPLVLKTWHLSLQSELFIHMSLRVLYEVNYLVFISKIKRKCEIQIPFRAARKLFQSNSPLIENTPRWRNGK